MTEIRPALETLSNGIQESALWIVARNIFGTFRFLQIPLIESAHFVLRFDTFRFADYRGGQQGAG